MNPYRPSLWSTLSIRTQILLIVLLAPLPVMALSVFQGYQEIQHSRRIFEDTILHAAQVNASEVERMLDDTEGILTVFSSLPSVQSLDKKDCSQALAKFPALFHSHSNIRTSDLEGNIICSALSAPQLNKLDKSLYKDDIVHKDGFSILYPLMGQISKKWIIPLDYPIRNSAGQRIGTISTPIDLENFRPFVTASLLRAYPQQTFSAIISDDFRILTAADNAGVVNAKAISHPLEESDDVKRLIEGTAYLTDLPLYADDIPRIHASAPIKGTHWTSVISVPQAYYDEQISSIITYRGTIIVFAYILSLGLAFFLSRRTAKPLVAVAEKTETFHEDGHELFVVKGSSCREVTRFVQTFNQLMSSLSLQHKELTSSENRYHSIFSGSRIPLLLIKPDTGEIFDANKSACDFYGWDLDTLRQMKIFDINALPADDIKKEMEKAEHEQRDHFHFKHRIKSGEIRDVEVHSSPIHMNGNTVLLSSVHDITKRVQAEKQLALAANVFLKAREGIVITDSNNAIVDVNDAFTQITGYAKQDVLGQKPSLLKSGRQSADFYSDLWLTLREKGSWTGEIWNRRKDGQHYAELASISLIYDDEGNVKNHLAIFSDITNIKHHQEQLERIAHYDSLTGLPNRVLLADRLQQAIAHSRRTQEAIAVVYLDLDGFKAINDSYGHETGDELLISVAHRMKSTLREEDTLARIGGDEFVAVLCGLKDINEYKYSLERLLRTTEEPVQIKSTQVTVSASAGVTLYPLDNSSADQLIRHADQAMYIAKQNGKNRHFLFDIEQDNAVKSHREALDHIETALREDQFVLFYQPKVNMSTGKVIGAEALIRWQHPTRGILPPADFLPVIEGTPLSAEVDNWVIERAMKQITQWKAQGFEIPLSVNVGAERLQNGNFVEHLRLVLSRYPEVSSRLLELELLESSALEDINKISELMTSCQKMGVRFALDDFGTGYSALTYLRRLPADVLKIDQSFIRGMLENPDDLAIVEGVLGLVSAFRCEAIAEGVETVGHGEVLLGLGCTNGQGYGIAKPMPAEKLKDWAEHWTPPEEWVSWQHKQLTHTEQRWMIAEIGHEYWVNSICKLVSENKGSLPPLDIHKCHFGRWLDNEGAALINDKPELVAVISLHEDMHALGKSIIDLYFAGEAGQALSLLGALRDKSDLFKSRLKTITDS